MMPSSRIRRRRSSWHPGSGRGGSAAIALGAGLTTVLLAVLLAVGPFLPVSPKSWWEVALLAVAALLFAIQGLRLFEKIPLGGDRRIDALDVTAILFALYAVIRWLTSPAEYVSRLEAMNVAVCAGIFLTCRYGMTSRRMCMILLYVVVGLGVAEMFCGYDHAQLAAWLPFNVDQEANAGDSLRWYGTFDSPNHYACFLIMASGVALALGGFAKLPWPARIVLVYVGLMLIVGVVYSGSRGGWLALAASLAGLVTMGIRISTLRWWWPLAGGLGVAAVAGFFFIFSPVLVWRVAQVSSAMGSDPNEFDPRVGLTRGGLHIAKDHPLFGTGPGTFEEIYPRYKKVRFDFYPERTHDDYLNTLDDYGLAGLALALAFVGLVTRRFFQPLMLDHRWQDRVMVAAGFAAWLALLVHSLVDYNLHIPANAFVFIALIGLAMGRFAEDGSLRWARFSLSRMGRGLGWSVALASVILGVLAARAALSQYGYETALERSDVVPVNDSIAGAQQALRYESDNSFALKFLGDLYRFRGAHQKTANDRLADALDALEAYKQAVRIDSLDASLDSRVGMALDLMGKYPEALGYYQTAVTLEPGNARFWQWLSDHYADSGMADAAKDAHVKAADCPFGGRLIAMAEKEKLEVPGGMLVRPAPPVPAPAPMPVPEVKTVTEPVPASPPVPPPPEVIYLPAGNSASTPAPTELPGPVPAAESPAGN